MISKDLSKAKTVDDLRDKKHIYLERYPASCEVGEAVKAGEEMWIVKAERDKTKKIEVDKKYPTLKIDSPYKIISITRVIVFL